VIGDTASTSETDVPSVLHLPLRALAGVLLAALVLAAVASDRAWGAGGDFGIDFAAAAPDSYDHSTGGGAFNDGGNDSVVEQLNGGDFACGDIVTFLPQVTVADDAQAAAQTITMSFSFDASTTGGNGEVGFDDIVNVQVNYGVGDTGIDDDGGSTATLTSETPPPEPFTGELLGTVTLDDLEPGEVVVVRIDVQLACGSGAASGNVQSSIESALNVVPDDGGTINVGNQTIPLQSPGDVVQPVPALSIDKQLTSTTDADGSGTVTLGDTLNYTITATNTGEVPLTGVTIADPLLPELTCDPAQPADLGLGASMVCTGSYVVDGDDVAAETVDNTATADSEQTEPVEDSVITPVGARPALAIDKQLAGNADEDGSGTVTLGDTLSYAITVTNTGDIALDEVTVSDSLIPLLTCDPEVPATLPVEGAIACTGTYVVTAQDVLAGSVANTATADSAQTTPVQDRVVVEVAAPPPPPPTPPVDVAGPGEQPVSTPAPRARLRTRKIGPRRMTGGRTAVYRIVVRNVSRVVARNVVIRDVLPRGVVLRSRPARSRISGRRIRWSTISRIAPGRRVVRVVRVRVLTSTRGRRCNNVVVTARNAPRTRARTCARVAPRRVRVIPAVTG
jgi:uncharacterized repeat protein (TIGR01451 family)